MTSIHRYAWRSLAPDLSRGLLGAAVSGGALALAPSSLHVLVIFGGLTLLFLLFTIRTALHQRTRVEVTNDAISVSGIAGGTIPWDKVDAVTLRYYSTRRGRGEGGWMTLKVGAGRRRLAVDSSIEGFEAIVACAALAARSRGLTLGETTRANLAALGIAAGPLEPSPGDRMP